MSEHWPRWINASINQHFDSNITGVKLFIEGQHRDTRTDEEFFELRVNGPYLTEVSKDYWFVEVMVNTLVQATMNNDLYRIQRLTGTLVPVYISIPMFRLGDGAEDDGLQFGCLKLVQDVGNRRRIKVDYFGQIRPETKLQQATVDADYYMYLET